MGQDASKSGSEITVKHVPAALEQIAELTAQVRTALSGLDPDTVVGHVKPDRLPPPVELVGKC